MIQKIATMAKKSACDLIKIANYEGFQHITCFGCDITIFSNCCYGSMIKFICKKYNTYVYTCGKCKHHSDQKIYANMLYVTGYEIAHMLHKFMIFKKDFEIPKSFFQCIKHDSERYNLCVTVLPCSKCGFEH